MARAAEKSPPSASRVNRAISAGISLDTTEITPRPPSAINGSVMASSAQHDEFVRNRIQNRRHLRNVSGGFFDAGDILNRREPLHGRGLDIHARAPLHAVQDYGKRDAFRDRLEVLKKPYLSGLVVVRRYGQNSVGANRRKFARQRDDFRGVVATRS